MSQTRAVLRVVTPANGAPETTCAGCRQGIVWSAKKKQVRVIANLYENGVWTDTVHFHDSCYAAAGEPYGEAVV